MYAPCFQLKLGSGSTSPRQKPRESTSEAADERSGHCATMVVEVRNGDRWTTADRGVGVPGKVRSQTVKGCGEHVLG